MFRLLRSFGRKPSFRLLLMKAHRRLRSQTLAQTRLPLLALGACFALGIGVGALWISQRSRTARSATSPSGVVLTEQTRGVLGRVESPLTLRFYALLDAANLPPGWPEFTQRVDRLLAAYQQQGGTNVILRRYDSLSDATESQAIADGIRRFNQDQGAACYLGIAVVQEDHSESLAHLDPEWESALEPDLTRAIARVITRPPQAPVNTMNATNQALAADQVSRAIPHPSDVSLEQGNQILRDAAMADFKAAVAAGAEQVKEAEQKVLEAQGKTTSEQQAALQHLQQVQAGQTQRLKEIAASLQNQMEIFQRLKAATNAP